MDFTRLFVHAYKIVAGDVFIKFYNNSSASLKRDISNLNSIFFQFSEYKPRTSRNRNDIRVHGESERK